MFGFLKGLFGPRKVEVTVHVEDIRVIISKSEPEEGSQAAVGPGKGSVKDGCPALIAPEVSDEEKLEEIGERFKNIKTPNVQFGEDK